MFICVTDVLEYIEEHGLQDKYTIVDNFNWYWIITEYVNGQCWYNVYYNYDYQYIDLEYSFSSLDLKECLEYCGIPYYERLY